MNLRKDESKFGILFNAYTKQITHMDGITPPPRRASERTSSQSRGGSSSPNVLWSKTIPFFLQKLLSRRAYERFLLCQPVWQRINCRDWINNSMFSTKSHIKLIIQRRCRGRHGRLRISNNATSAVRRVQLLNNISLRSPWEKVITIIRIVIEWIVWFAFIAAIATSRSAWQNVSTREPASK